MEENNRKGPGVFYAVVGVATLVVAIVGATFAFFSAQTPDDKTIGGQTAEVAALSLKVTPVANPTQGLVPQDDAGIQSAVRAGCVDTNQNAVCKVYKITITNPGSAAVMSKGTLALAPAEGSGNAFEHLQWALVTGVGEADALTNATVSTTINGMSAATIAEPTLAATDGVEGSGTDQAVYYVAVWIKNLTSDQTNQDKGSFVGTVSWAGADGEIKVQSTFTA